MIANLFRNPFKKRRKYPIKKDEFGMSRRQWAFSYFDRGMSPAEVAAKVGISVKTARRYKADWNKRTANMEIEYRVLKNIQKNKPEQFEGLVTLWSEFLGMAKEEVVERLQKPWGLKQLLLRKWPNYAGLKVLEKLNARVAAALKFVRLANRLGMSTEQIEDMVQEIADMAISRMRHKHKNTETT
jgi:transposase